MQEPSLAAKQSAVPLSRAVVLMALLGIVALVSLPVVETLVSGDASIALVLTLASIEVALGVAGALWLHRRQELVDRPASTPQWRSALWLLALCLPWAGLIVLTRQAAYLGIVLYFLALWLLPPFLGEVAALSLAVLTGFGQSVHHGWSTGAFLGPLAGVAVLIVMVMGFRSLIAQSTARAELIDALETAQAKLSESEREAGRLAERTRLGRELHDTVAQHLSSIQLLLHAAEAVPGDDARAAHLQAARDAASSALTDTRAFIADLTPAPLAGQSLATALERVVAAVNQRGRVSTRLLVTGQSRGLSTAVEATALRIVQESLANVEKHAGANQVDVNVEYAEEYLSVEVSDDGAGFDVPATLESIDSGDRQSFGLAGMRARAAELGGYVAIVGEPGEGTLVSAHLPAHEVAPTVTEAS